MINNMEVEIKVQEVQEVQVYLVDIHTRMMS